MKICIITNTYSADLIGGSNIYTNLIVRELHDRKHEVIVIAATANKKDSIEICEMVKIYYFHPLNVATCSEIGKRSALEQGLWTLLDVYSPWSYIKIMKILRKERPDVVHVHTPLDITLSVFDAAKKLKLPVVFTAHDYLLLCRRVVLLHKNGAICTGKNINQPCLLYRFLVKKIIGDKIDVAIFPSEFTCRLFENNGFLKKTKKSIVPHPIQPTSVVLLKSAAGASTATLNVLYVGGLSRHKGVDILIKAVRGIWSDSIKLSIVGSGRCQEELKEVAYGDKRIEFHGKVNNEETQDFYRNSDVLVVPSVCNEVFGMVILEAFSAGVPVVASRIGGIVEVVKHGHNGFLFEPGDVEGLKKNLENILANPNLLAELSRNAKNCAKQYETPIHMKRLILSYEEAIRINKTRQGE